MEDLGTVDGDVSAKAIIEDRRSGRGAIRWGGTIAFVLLIASFAWWTQGKSDGSVGALILTFGWWLQSLLADRTYDTQTMVIVAERRAQLLEQQVQALHDEVQGLKG